MRPTIADLLSRLWDLLLLNILFLLTCIPVLTVGASLCALHSVSQQLAETGSTHIAADYFQAFRQHFPGSLVPTLGFFLGFGFLLFDILAALSHTGGVFGFLGIAATVFAVVLYVLFLFFFPVSARFHLRAGETISYIALAFRSQPGICAGIILISLPFPFFALYSLFTAAAVAAFGLVIGFALMSYVKSYLFCRLFHLCPW